MSKNRYRAVIEFIAYNDEPMCLDAKEVASFISVITASVAFEKPEIDIARDVVNLRKNTQKGEIIL